MQPTDDIPRMIRQLRVPASAELDQRVHAEIARAAAQRDTAAEKDPGLWQILRLFMRNKSVRYTIGSAAALALLATLILNHSSTSAWAIDQAIEALKKYKAVHITGYTTATGEPTAAEMWAQANPTGTRSEAFLMKAGRITAWVKDNKTYIYDAGAKTVYIDPAVTIGFAPWFGEKFLRMLSKLPDYRAVEGEDSATGQKRILVTASLDSALGPQSFALEFDAKTQLPVSMKHWNNASRSGAPDFSLDKFTFFDDLPDSAFAFDPPAGVNFVDRPLTIAEPNLQLLANPKSGIAVDGLSREQACRKILEQLWTAVIQNDFGRIRQLCPVTASWPDALLRDAMAEDDPVELLQVGAIEKEGQSRLGPLALVPSRIRCRDGKVRVVKIVVQFRQTDKGTWCVINGNFGHSIEVE